MLLAFSNKPTCFWRSARAFTSHRLNPSLRKAREPLQGRITTNTRSNLLWQEWDHLVLGVVGPEQPLWLCARATPQPRKEPRRPRLHRLAEWPTDDPENTEPIRQSTAEKSVEKRFREKKWLTTVTLRKYFLFIPTTLGSSQRIFRH